MSTENREMPVFVYTWSEHTSIDYAISSHIRKRGLVPTGLQVHNCAAPVKWLCQWRRRRSSRPLTMPYLLFLPQGFKSGYVKRRNRKNLLRLFKVPTGFEPVNNGFADRPLRPLGYSSTLFSSKQWPDSRCHSMSPAITLCHI